MRHSGTAVSANIEEGPEPTDVDAYALDAGGIRVMVVDVIREPLLRRNRLGNVWGGDANRPSGALRVSPG
jgi:hypothetical protein